MNDGFDIPLTVWLDWVVLTQSVALRAGGEPILKLSALHAVSA